MKKLLATSLMIVGLALVGVSAVSGVAYAANDVCSDPSVSDELKEVAGCNVKDKTLMPVAINMIQIVLGIMGVLAVGTMIYGGITYALSTGDAAKVTKAKNIIMYSIIGLVVAMLAYAIVYFVSGAIWG